MRTPARPGHYWFLRARVFILSIFQKMRFEEGVLSSDIAIKSTIFATQSSRATAEGSLALALRFRPRDSSAAIRSAQNDKLFYLLLPRLLSKMNRSLGCVSFASYTPFANCSPWAHRMMPSSPPWTSLASPLDDRSGSSPCRANADAVKPARPAALPLETFMWMKLPT